MRTNAELLFKAEQHLERGELDEAAQLFDQAFDANPQSPNAAIGMARVASALGQYREALQILDRVLHKVPEHPRALEVQQAVLAQAQAGA
jgi:thioredoxin-like negative regulator of GroEL